ncbi:lyase family protein [uncultured Pseudacidovorax sp.]|uniref:lyase family protein n=1 Tax=uncultured Pseudacidovorax sp. TaxID=679313 RepID=UPI0025D29AF4|nr:lyase family protein [uncultured Pseudacidovorax sp.]
MLCLSDDACATPEGAAVRQIFSARASVAGILAFEAALARVQARRGLIPQAAAEDMAAKAQLSFFPEDEWARRRAQVGHPLVAILDTWRGQLAPESREWLHYGATTADLFNTVLVQQLQAAGAQLVAQMRGIEERMAAIAAENRATPMVARTLGRHALPFTFGMKVATWLAEHGRSIERLQGWLARYRTGILSGAVGTYASFGDAGPAIEREVMAELGLDTPEAVDWKGSRDRFAEFGCAVALAAATAGHVGQEIFLLCGDDLDELREATGAVGSSTMPHKSNPSLSIEVVSRSREVSARLQPLLAWIGIVYERDSAQHGEVLRDMCLGMADLLATLQQLLDVLVVLPQNMAANLARSRGLVLSEAITFALAGHLGKHTAHEKMKQLTRTAQAQGCSLQQAAQADATLAPLLAELPGLFDATSHLGQAVAIADAAVARVHPRTPRAAG